MLIVIWLAVLFPTYTVAGQPDCSQCACCKNSVCSYEGNTACKDGCNDGFWGNMCTNECTGNCLACPQDNSQYCTKCKDGYYLNKYTNTDYGVCESCDTRYCQTCTSWTHCLTCTDGFFNDLSLVQSSFDCKLTCPRNCASCVNGTECVSCKDGYYNGYGFAINDHTYHSDCSLTCRSQCKQCTDYDNCNKCYNGFYGNSCHNTCNVGCKKGVCFKESGACVHGCKIGYTGDLCNFCDTGFNYVDEKFSNCTYNCADCSVESFCTKCKDRYTGLSCQTPCPDNCRSCTPAQTCDLCENGYFGQTCSQLCPTNCLDRKCNIGTGNCLACKHGLSGSTCDDKCQNNCLNRTCNIDGSCVSCEPGFYGDYCKSKCPYNCITCMSYSSCTRCTPGYYTYTCNHQCSNCLEGRCGLYNGNCIDGCKDGWNNIDCRTPCSQFCKACEKDNYYKCTKCTDGRYGTKKTLLTPLYMSCHLSCSSTCLNSKCDERNGLCTSGCVKGHWGTECLNICPANCRNGECFHNTGLCKLGCKEGYKGDKCDCPMNCECDVAGTCTRCLSGFGNLNKRCMCKTDVCEDSSCLRCTSKSFYAQGGACCPCSSNCKDGACLSAVYCSRGCESGYYGYDCAKKCAYIDQWCAECPINYGPSNNRCYLCKPGYYPSEEVSRGYHRCKQCQTTCLDNKCDGSNGTCLNGCIDGTWGLKCQNDCPTNCVNCTRSNGNCTLCKGGKYLSDCSKSCSAGCKRNQGDQLCAIETGECLDGCASLTMYGKQCDKKCSDYCLYNECDWLTGDCVKGCQENNWGKQCEHVCNDNCKPIGGANNCNESSGHCLAGCIDGHYSFQCDKNCSINCLNTSCDTRGRCIYGCSGDFVDDSCLQVKFKPMQDSGGSAGKIGGIVGGVVALLIISGVVIVVVLFKRRHRKDEANMKNESHQSTNAVRFSEVAERGRQTELNDSVPVYATPDKPKSKKDTAKTHTVNNPSYQKRHIEKTQSGIEKDATVYENAVQREDVREDLKPETGNSQSLEDSTEASGTRQSLGRYLLELEDPNENVGSSSAAVVLGSGSHVKESNEGDTYYNTAEMFKRKISLDKLADFVDKKTTECLEEEFKLLPEGLIKKYTESQKKDNITKNRYRGIYPYDNTRVVLRDGESDYINASYIDGFKKLKAYIASLGPTYKYMDDMSAFWRMVWQEKCGKIIMLTNLMEAGTSKCDQYWPMKDSSQLYADIHVTCLSEETYADYTVRVFNIQKKSARRTVTQVHFTAWPDRGVPDDVTCLIEFRQRVVSVKTNLDGPILVHCSAGIGRTGTYIALNSLTKEGESEGNVDIYACVRNLREQRVNMIQTAEQYEYLHRAVVHSLTFNSHAIGLYHFQQYMTTHESKTLAQMFQDLEHSVEKKSKDENEAIKRNSAMMEKNRKGADIPGDQNRPRLYLTLKPGASDYVNALYVNSFRHVNRFLLAQTPLPDTVDDFLTLVVEEKCSCIVNMEPETNKSKDVGIYYPADNQTLKRGPFTVRTERVSSTQNFTHRRLTISNHGKAGSEDHIVQHFQLTSWVDGMKCPDDAASFLDFLHHVELKSGGAEAGPVLVHCLTGAEKCGLFCVVSILLEKLQCDQEVSVVNTVRQVKSRRRRVTPNQEQYNFCHQCVNEYIQSFDNYSNFVSKQ